MRLDEARTGSRERQLEGTVAVVTGGGRGLGAATCRALAEAGARVVAADVRPDLAEELAGSLASDGHDAEAIELDVTDDASAEAGILEVVRRLGRIDILVNNAGADVTASFEELSPQDWDRVLGVNLLGPVRMSRLAFPHLRESGGGHVVNVASTAAKRAWANASAYHASKWGLLGFSHALHVEGRPMGIKVTAVVAGGMRTPFLLDRFSDLDLDTLQDPRNVAETIRFVVTQPAGTVIPEVMVIPMRETSWP
ncbi:MAG TPA: SDR family oxidoreductase [Actinomycetota bacterium]|jgi:NAD(P)-dependent dehydrogenase (short-subunit alcohol dehydrogenase family)|nr:SDR family oxidoreductase [Actinomycetota bacterium]